MAVDILPGRRASARRMNDTYNQARRKSSERLKLRAFFAGGKMRVLHVRQDARRYPHAHHRQHKLTNTFDPSMTMV